MTAESIARLWLWPCGAIGLNAMSVKRTSLATSLIGAFAILFLGGCSSFSSRDTQPKSEVMKEVMERKDRIILLSGDSLVPDRPVILLLHGATDDPSEMLAIAGQWAGSCNVFLYSYNFHHSIEKVASDLAQEIKALKSMTETLTRPESAARNVTVIAYSYAAIVFRKSVLLSDNKTLFSRVSLIQLVPTAGGSLQARGMENPVAASLVSVASKPSAAENPYGSTAEELWDDEGTRKFHEAMSPSRVRTLLVEVDSHSLANVDNEGVQRRYRNGIGTNVVVIPKQSGVTHENFPNHPVALAYLKEAIESTARDRADEARRARREFTKNDGSLRWRARFSRWFHNFFPITGKASTESASSSH